MRGLVALALVALASHARAAGEDDEPPSLPAAMHPEAEQAAKLMRVPAGVRVDVWAKEPLLRNPVAFAFDERGRAFVAETFRHTDGGLDNRGRAKWPGEAFRKSASPERLARIEDELLDRELAARTLADRAAMVREIMDAEYMTSKGDRLSLVEDTNGDGVADRTKVFAGPFADALDGLAAGVLARKGDVFLANIPHLWRLRDRDGDGVAEERRALHTGYGVRYAFIGHDLHGLRIGPDGRLYFTVGDRGAHVETEGRTLAVPDQGAVFRCELDGSRLEVFATGLRNPQELAFDERGNLFTGDNNSDGGDKARWVYLVEGGDNGWRVGYQYLADRGPWNREKLWHPRWEGQAAEIVPPLANITNGPSGLTYWPGTGRLRGQEGRFFLVDFRGQASTSGVWSLGVKPAGAGFEMADPRRFVWGVTATDADFGPDGALYVLDWVQGWARPGKGRIFRVHDPAVDLAAADATRRLIAEGMERRSERDLAGLLAHADMRVRQEAQLELVRRGLAAPLVEAARQGRGLARLHGVWGAGHLLRAGSAAARSTAAAALPPLLADPDAEVRGQVAKVLAEGNVVSAVPALRAMLRDPAPRARFFAAIALGRLRRGEATPDLLSMLERDGRDPWLRHAAVMGLAGAAQPKLLAAAALHASPPARLGAMLALRRLRSPEVARFLGTEDATLTREAARAINDVPIDAATEALAAITPPDAPTAVRVVNANLRLGTAAAAARVAALAAQTALPSEARAEALGALGDWAAPSSRDRVTGAWRPVAPKGRQADAAAPALAGKIVPLLRDRDPAVQLAAVEVTRKLRLAGAAAPLAALAVGRAGDGALRAEALGALAAIQAPSLDSVLGRAARDPSVQVRVQALRLQVDRAPARAAPLVSRAMARGSVAEKQLALASLARLPGATADRLLVTWLDQALAGRVAPEITLDLLEAAAARKSPPVEARLAAWEARRPKDELGRFREALHGGDRHRGWQIFHNKAEVSCLRCHRLGQPEEGGEVGPDLAGIARTRGREYLLEAVVAPNKHLAPGFESVILDLKDGNTVGGIVKQETADTIELLSPEGLRTVVKKADVKARGRGASGMPDGLGDILTRRELRDLVEFLTTLK